MGKRLRPPSIGDPERPLVLVAGLPNPEFKRAESVVPAVVGGWAKVIALPSGKYAGTLYPETLIGDFLRAAAQFSARVHGDSARRGGPRPSDVLLFYVPAEDQENLLSKFDFAVFPVALRDLSGSDSRDKQKRYDGAAYENAFSSALLCADRGKAKRLLARSSPMALPPRNFHLDGGRRIDHEFRLLRDGQRPWSAPWRLHQQRSSGQATAFYDERDVIFPVARELHGTQRTLDSNAGANEFQGLLRSLYRFGVPLENGFHHDVRRRDGHDFSRMPFDCSRQGRVLVSGTHANVYPNDSVAWTD